MDKIGDIAIPIQFYSADIFSEGLASVRLPHNLANSGYIDKTGALVIQPRFGLAQPFSEGLAADEPGPGMLVFEMNTSGEILHQWAY